jgi:hypothetical protein
MAKLVFHLVAIDESGEVAIRKRFTRAQLVNFTANLKTDVIGLEACPGGSFPGSRPDRTETLRAADAGRVCARLCQIEQE